MGFAWGGNEWSAMDRQARTVDAFDRIRRGEQRTWWQRLCDRVRVVVYG